MRSNARLGDMLRHATERSIRIARRIRRWDYETEAEHELLPLLRDAYDAIARQLMYLQGYRREYRRDRRADALAFAEEVARVLELLETGNVAEGA